MTTGLACRHAFRVMPEARAEPWRPRTDGALRIRRLSNAGAGAWTGARIFARGARGQGVSRALLPQARIVGGHASARAAADEADG